MTLPATPRRLGQDIIPLAEWKDFTQQGFGDLVMERMGDNHLWLADRNCWAYYNEYHWHIQNSKDNAPQRRIARDLAAEIGYIPAKEDDPEYTTKLRQWKHAVKNDHTQCAAVHGIQTVLLTTGIVFDQGQIINTREYAIDLPALLRRNLSKEDYCCRALGTLPDNSGCPRWINFVDEITCGDKELALYLQCLAGYCLTPWLNEPSLIIAYGKGRNGKTTFFNILACVAGDYVVYMPKELVIGKTEKNNIDWNLTRMEGARFALIAETSVSDRLNDGKVKQLTGTERVSVQAKFGTPYEIRAFAKIIVYTNFPINIRGGDPGTWRRIHNVPFAYYVPDDKVIPPEILLPSLMAELPGIAAWVLEGLRLYIANNHKLPDCKAVTKATKEYRHSEDVVMQFLDQYDESRKYGIVRAKTLYDEYKIWSEGEGFKPMGSRGFYTELRNHNVRVDTDNYGKQCVFWDGEIKENSEVGENVSLEF
jgi:P4 family phage/plasmid primase-like protien